MKTIKFIFLMVLPLLFLACDSDDDGGGLSNQELLVLGTWYQETTTEGAFSPCEKNTSFTFNEDNTLSSEVYDDGSGTCESVGVLNATYSLINDVDLTIDYNGLPTLNSTIISIDENLLVIENEDGERIALDKIQG